MSIPSPSRDALSDANAPLFRCGTVTLTVLAVDLASKLLAQVMLGTSTVGLPAGGFLKIVYNDGFARGPSLGALTLPATLLLAAALLYLLLRVCSPLAAVDRKAPIALGLVAGATVGNAADLLLTGRGVVDFLGVSTSHGAIVFNLADVAAYAGVALLARTGWVLARLVWAEWREAARVAPPPRYPRLHATAEAAWAARKAARRPALELVRPIPVYLERSSIDTDRADVTVTDVPLTDVSIADMPAAARSRSLPESTSPSHQLTIIRGGPGR